MINQFFIVDLKEPEELREAVPFCITFAEYAPLLLSNNGFFMSTMDMAYEAIRTKRFKIIDEHSAEYSIFEFLGLISYEKRLKKQPVPAHNIYPDADGFSWTYNSAK